MGITFKPKEALGVIANCCLRAYCQAQGMPPDTGNMIGAIAEGTIKSIGLQDQLSPVLDTLKTAMKQSIHQTLQLEGLEYLDDSFEDTLLEKAFSVSAIRDYLTNDDPVAILEENIRTALEVSEIYDAGTLPVSSLAVYLIENIHTTIQNQHDLTALATFYTVQDIRAELLQPQYEQYSQFEKEILNMRQISEFHSPNPLHFLNQDIGFQGRTDEFRWLDQFRDSQQALQYAFIQGSGGVGKSRLLYEYISQRSGDNDWIQCFLSDHLITSLLHFDSYVCSKNLLVVIDYAGRYSDIIGKWILKLAETKNFKYKIRIILIERHGVQNTDGVKHFSFWTDTFYGNVHQKRILDEVEYGQLTISQLGKSELFCMMDDYSIKVAKKGPLTDGDKEQIFQYVSAELKLESARQTPLLILLATDAFICENSIRNWDINLLTKNYVDRMLEYWLETLCHNDTRIYCSLRSVIVFATAVNGIDLNDTGPACISADIEQVLKVAECQEILKNSSGLNGDSVLPLQPDYIGEFVVLQYLSEIFPLKKRHALFDALYSKPVEFMAFFLKCIDDFACADIFRTLFDNIVETIKPTNITPINYAAYGTIIRAFSMTCTYEEKVKCSGELSSIFNSEIMKDSQYFEYLGLLYCDVLVGITYIYNYDTITETALSRIMKERTAYAHDALEKIQSVCHILGDKNPKLILLLAQALANCSIYGTYLEAESYANELRELYIKHCMVEPKISVPFAMAMNNIIFKLTDISEPSLAALAENAVSQLAKLYEKHVSKAEDYSHIAVCVVNAVSDSELRKSVDEQTKRFYAMMDQRQIDIAVEYAKAINNIVSLYVRVSREKAFEHFATLEDLYSTHKENETRVMVEYAKAMVALVGICSGDDADHMLQTLQDLCDQYQGDKFISELLIVRYAKALCNRLVAACRDGESGGSIDWAFNKLVSINDQYGKQPIIQICFISALYYRFIIQIRNNCMDDCNWILKTMDEILNAADGEVSATAEFFANEIINFLEVNDAL